METKPRCPLIGADGNIFNVLGLAAKTLRNNGREDKVREMLERAKAPGNDYHAALGVVMEYVDPVSVEEPSDLYGPNPEDRDVPDMEMADQTGSKKTVILIKERERTRGFESHYLGTYVGAVSILNRTLYGRHLVATGANLEAAKVSGIRIDSIRISAYIIIGICAGITSVILTGRLGMGSPSAGNTYTLDCIAAVVIGGTSMKGGKPKVVGTLFGMGLIVVINNMLSLLGVDTYWQMVSKGAIIVLAIVLDSLSEKFVALQRTNV